MIQKEKPFILIIALILLCLLLSACDGSLGSSGGSQGSSNDPDPTLEGGMGQAGEDQSSESGDELEPVPLTKPCQYLRNELFVLSLQYEKLVWFGPPEVEITSGGGPAHLAYEFNKDLKEGVFYTPNEHQENIVDLTIRWPECIPGASQTTTKYTPFITGSCKGDRVELIVSEDWNTSVVPLLCREGTELCDDDGGCPVTFPLPFSYGMGQNKLVFVIDYDGTITPESITVPFKGQGGAGTKIYTLDNTAY